MVTMGPSGTVMEIWRLQYWTHGPGHRKKDGRMEKEKKRRKREGKKSGKREGKKKEKRNGR